MSLKCRISDLYQCDFEPKSGHFVLGNVRFTHVWLGGVIQSDESGTLLQDSSGGSVSLVDAFQRASLGPVLVVGPLKWTGRQFSVRCEKVFEYTSLALWDREVDDLHAALFHQP